jgi:ABC-type polysaccharide/polyol phosphate transport system ATPase subunit
MSQIIQLKGLGKKYFISHEKDAMVRRIFPSLLKIKRVEEFWALRDIDLCVRKGESLGVIGRNGAGKSTLLNLLAGITSPTEGVITKKGKACAVLSLGAGFNSELTGEENIYLNASILGLGAKQVNARFKDIVEFSELNNFIDALLKTYSAGMYMRLGFAIAIHSDFDILLLDELLTVGDIGFQKKCLSKLKQLRQDGRTLVMVSQSLDLLSEICDRVILLEKGRIEFIGSPDNACARYKELVESGQARNFEIFKRNIPIQGLGYLDVLESEQVLGGWHTKTTGNQSVIERVRILDGAGKESKVFQSRQDLSVSVDFKNNAQILHPHFGVAILRHEGIYCYGPNTKFDGISIHKMNKGSGNYRIDFKKPPLGKGKYAVSAGIWDDKEKAAYDFHNTYYDFEVDGKADCGFLNLDYFWRFPKGVSQNPFSSSLKTNDLVRDFTDKSWLQDYDCDILKSAILDFRDFWNKDSSIFKTGERFGSFLTVETKKDLITPVLWSAIFGEDKLCCQSIFTGLNKIEKGKTRLGLIYPSLNLLPRLHPAISVLPKKYALAFAIFTLHNNEIKKIITRCKIFAVNFNKPDHGVVFIKHKWKIKLP